MKQYLIEEVKTGVSNGGMACGPVSGNACAELKVKTAKGSELYFSMVEVDGMPHFYRTKKSVISLLMEDFPESMTDDDIQAAFDDLNDNHLIACFDDYYTYFEEGISRTYKAISRCLVYLVRADWDETDEFKKECTDKWIGELEIPASDVEEEWLEEMGEYDE